MLPELPPLPPDATTCLCSSGKSVCNYVGEPWDRLMVLTNKMLKVAPTAFLRALKNRADRDYQEEVGFVRQSRRGESAE